MKKIKIATILTFLFCILCLSLYWNATKNEYDLTDTIRSKQKGKIISLPNGKIYYDWHGSENGDIIILVHGFSTPSFVFYKNVDELVNAGYRVLTFDHFGRGYSDHIDAIYDKEFFNEELTNLVKALQIDKPFYLIGYSMGGGIAAVFTSRNPKLVKKLILLAPAGFVPEFSGKNRLALIPYLGEWLMAVVGKKNLMNSFIEDQKKGMLSTEIVQKYKEQLEFKGYRNALLSTMRNYPLQNLSAEYKLLGESNIPTLLIWGTKDSVVPFEGAKKIQQLVSNSKLISLDGVEHSLVYSDSETVNKSILDFLNR